MGARYYYDAKRTVEESTELSIFRLNGFGLLKGYRCENLTWTRRLSGHKSSIDIVVDVTAQPYAKLNYTVTRRDDGGTEDFDYSIGLTTTPCHLGGKRYWFSCPQCGRRVGKLYLVGVGTYFNCRECYDLTYESRNAPSIGRHGGAFYFMVAERKADELVAKIKRRTWRGKPTRKMRRLYHFERHADIDPRSRCDAIEKALCRKG
jgi:hypothetical protein